VQLRRAALRQGGCDAAERGRYVVSWCLSLAYVARCRLHTVRTIGAAILQGGLRARLAISRRGGGGDKSASTRWRQRKAGEAAAAAANVQVLAGSAGARVPPEEALAAAQEEEGALTALLEAARCKCSSE
jgi:hypothetical protein